MVLGAREQAVWDWDLGSGPGHSAAELGASSVDGGMTAQERGAGKRVRSLFLKLLTPRLAGQNALR